MQFEILGPAPRTLGLLSFGEALINVLSDPDTRSVCVAVAYIHSGAIEIIGQHFSNILQRGGTVSAVVGIQNSSARAVRDLASIIGADNLSLYWQKGRGNFHPKIYIAANQTDLDSADKMNIFVGSSNLTGAGLEYNLEMNVHLQLCGPDDAAEMNQWKSRWSLLKGLPGIHSYSEALVNQLAQRGAFRPSRPGPNLEDLLPTATTTPMPIITLITATYIQTLVPNDFPPAGESDAIIPRAARNANPQFWGWRRRFRLSPGGHPQRHFPNTQIQFGSQVITTSCRLYEVESVANFRLSCTAVRSLLPASHEDYILTLRIENNNCQMRFLSPDDEDYHDFFLATQPLTNSRKRWGYL